MRFNIYELSSWAIALAFLIAIILYARRRVAARSSARPRIDRIWHVAILFAALGAATIAPRMARYFTIIDTIVNTLGWFVLVGTASLFWVWVVDWVLLRMEAVRTERWLLFSAGSFALGFALLVLTPMLLWEGRYPRLDMVPLLINSAAAGIWWWSYLQDDDPRLERVFE